MKELMISIISILSCVLTWQPSMQTQEEVGYVYHPVYFLEELAGKGVFVSEEMSETEGFIAQLLMEVIDGRGNITDTDKQYFSDWAVQQLKSVDWNRLDSKWSADRNTYDRYFTLCYLFENEGYEFTYCFYRDRKGALGYGAQWVKERFLVDDSGIIRGISVDINDDGAASGNIPKVDTAQLYHNEFREKVVEEGLVPQGKIFMDIEEVGLLSSKDAALCAEEMGQALISNMENRTLPNQECGQLEKNWKASPYFDCYYIDMTEAGQVGFLYYIYPDYDRMNTESAKAVTFRYNVDIHTGETAETQMGVYPMTREEYQAAREWTGEKYQVIRDGHSVKGGCYQDCIIAGSDSSMEDVGQYFWENLETVEPVREKLEEGWKFKKYDGYYYDHNVWEGCIHCQYYFYMEKADEEKETVFVLDTWISNNGVEDMQISRFMTCKSRPDEGGPVNTGITYEMADIAAFLTYDWTSEKILLGHSIRPWDSGWGWDFSVADVDFDGIPEMLVQFPAMYTHRGLYIYKQQDGYVFSYAETLAAREDYINGDIDYKEISPYMDINLLSAYRNEDNEYRYLSLDDNSTSAPDIHGNFDTIVLYETTLGEQTVPKELVRIEYGPPSKEREMYFCGERIYEAGELRDRIADYMDGFTEVGIPCATAEKSFERYMLGHESEDEIKAELEELYESLKKLATDGKKTVLTLSDIDFECDLSFLSEMKNLKELWIKRSDISDLSFLENMTGLESIYIEYVSDGDLKYLEKLENLRMVHIVGEHIQNLDSLENLVHMKELYLDTDELMRSERTVTDISVLSNLKELESLVLGHMNINDVTPLSELKALRFILLVDTGITDIMPLAQISSLKFLNISGNDSEEVERQAQQYFSEIDTEILEEVSVAY